MTITSLVNGSGYNSLVFNTSGDLAIVVESLGANTKKGMPVSDNTLKWINSLQLGKRLSSIHIVHPYKKVSGKKVPLAKLREGWKRVKGELPENVKRILVLSASELVNKVIVPGVDKGMADIHGTIFTLPCGLEVVPTFQKVYAHMRSWFDTDVKRFVTMVKPEKPLSYEHNIHNMPDTVSKIVIDFESSGLNPDVDYITTMGVQWSRSKRALLVGNERIWSAIKHIGELAKSGTEIWFHNAIFDLGFMTQEFRDNVADSETLRDTFIRSKVLGHMVSSLKHLGNTFTSRPGCYAWTIVGEKFRFDNPAYVCEDLAVTWELSELWKHLDSKPATSLHEQATAMASIQRDNGSKLDVANLATLEEAGAKEVSRLREELIKEYGVDPGSQELGDVLASRGYDVYKNTKTGKYTLTAEILEELGLDDIVAFRQAQKLDSAFVGKLYKLVRKDGTVPHTQTMLAARTGRTTMKNYNHQQSGKKGPVKKLLISRFENGVIANCDFKQAEVRVGAYLTNDMELAKALMLKDMHRANAARGFAISEDEVTDEQRDEAKKLIFRSMFAGEPQNDIQERVCRYMEKAFHRLYGWIAKQKVVGQNSSFITDCLGKIILLQDIHDYKNKWAAGRVAVNAPIQGTQSHIAIWITLRAFKLFRKFKLRSMVLFGVHDSFVSDIHPEEIDIATKLIGQAFQDLRESVFFKLFPLMKILPMEGEMQMASNWGDTKAAPKINFSSLEGYSNA